METKKRQREEPSPPVRNVRSVFPGAPIESIPDEILCHIFLFVDPIFDAFPILETCCRWYNCFYDVTLNPSNWKDRKAARAEKGPDERFVDVFLVYHLRRHHTSVLRHYVGNRHISMAVPDIRENVDRALDEGPLDLIKWLHCDKNVELHEDRLFAWMKAARTEALDWVVDTKKPVITYGNRLGSVRVGTYVRRNARKWVLGASLENAIEWHNEKLWEWRWRRILAEGVLSEIDLVLTDVLEHGFARALRDIIKYREREVPREWEDAKALLELAVAGDNKETLDLLFEAFQKKHYRLEDCCDFIRRTACTALVVRTTRSYIWLDCHFPRAVKGVLTVAKVERIMRSKPRECIPFVSYVLERYPKIVDQLNRREGVPLQHVATRSLKHIIVRERLTELLGVLNDKGCLVFSREDLARMISWYIQAGSSIAAGTLAGEFVRQVAGRIGLTEPITWTIGLPLDRWK